MFGGSRVPGLYFFGIFHVARTEDLGSDGREGYFRRFGLLILHFTFSMSGNCQVLSNSAFSGP